MAQYCNEGQVDIVKGRGDYPSVSLIIPSGGGGSHDAWHVLVHSAGTQSTS